MVTKNCEFQLVFLAVNHCLCEGFPIISSGLFSTKQDLLRNNKLGIVHCGVFVKSWLGALSFSSKEFILHMMSKVESN